MIKKGFILFFCFSIAITAFSQQATNADDTTILSGEALGTKVWALVPQSVINLRRAPAYPSEMITQALMGTPIKILAKKKIWYKIQTPEGYEGWTSTPLFPLDEADLHKQNNREKLMVTVNNAFVFTKPKKQEDIVSEVVMGNIIFLESKRKKRGFYAVSFADGRTGYVHENNVKKWNDWQHSIQFNGTSIESVAKKFTGVPYFWGGTSSRGLDCSGLTKLTYFMHGIILPRDAWQQYETGEAVDSTDNFSHLQKGDLLFFGKRKTNDSTKFDIKHTAIYLGNGQFIHAGDGWVQLNSLNPTDTLFDKHNFNRYVIAKRFLNNNSVHTMSVFKHPWYN